MPEMNKKNISPEMQGIIAKFMVEKGQQKKARRPQIAKKAKTRKITYLEIESP